MPFGVFHDTELWDLTAAQVWPRLCENLLSQSHSSFPAEIELIPSDVVMEERYIVAHPFVFLADA